MTQQRHIPTLSVLAASACVLGTTTTVCAGPPRVFNARALSPWVEKAATGRADVVALGDSNQVHMSDGWDHGWSKALSERFGLYSTALLTPGENYGSACGMGWTCQILTPFPSAIFQTTGAPSALDQYMASSGLMEPLNYLYLPTGLTAANVSNQGLFVERTSPLNVNAALRFRVVYGEFGDGAGSFRLSVKFAEPPWNTLTAGPVISTGGPGAGVRIATLDLAAGARNGAVNFRFAPDEEAIQGPFIAYLMRAENLDRAAGAASHTLYYKGLQSARDMAAAMQAASDAYLTMYFGEVRALQDSPVRVLVRINAGVNDRSEPLVSVGPAGVTPGSSPAAFADNLEAIMARVRGVWALNNWDQRELAFLVSVTHPIAQPDDAQLTGFRAAADALARRLPAVAVTHFDRITNTTEMIQNNWYMWSGFDRNHLRMAGYENLSTRELNAIIEDACAGDCDGDGTIDTNDLVLLLSQFGQMVPMWTGADSDGNGTVDTADLVNVLAVFGAGCGGN